jgi:putative photosynthetic complex assembly protein 2
MTNHVLPALFVVGVWWLSTGLILAMVWLRRSTFAVSLALSTALGLGALAGLVSTREQQTPQAAYLAFVFALTVWGWHEVMFLQGVLTGPRALPCPEGATGLRRFTAATLCLLWHELALAATMLAILALTWRAPNQVGAQTFGVLWVMRLSSKLNLFLGVRNFTEEFIPAHLNHLLSYVKRARFNPLMPFSVSLASAVVLWLVVHGFAAGATPWGQVSHALIAALLALAVLEHLFLAIPLRDAWLWRWALGRRAPQVLRIAPSPTAMRAPP